MKLVAIVGDVAQGPKVGNLARDEGAASDANFTGALYITLEGDAAGFGGKAGGSGHHKTMITHDMPLVGALAVTGS